jgi:hypothetical protein
MSTGLANLDPVAWMLWERMVILTCVKAMIGLVVDITLILAFTGGSPLLVWWAIHGPEAGAGHARWRTQVLWIWLVLIGILFVVAIATFSDQVAGIVAPEVVTMQNLLKVPK